MLEPPTATTPSSPSQENAAHSPGNPGVEAARLRSEVYLFLSRALLYPREDIGLAWQRAAVAASALMGEPGGVFLSLEPPPLEALRQEYVAAFTHTSPKDYPVYEVEYAANVPFRDSRHLSRLADFYRAFGLQPVPGERLDHIGVELEFMYFLTYKEAYAGQHQGPEKAEICRYAQGRFLEEHLGCWASPFFRQLRERGPGYYSRLASAGLSFLDWERQHLAVKPAEVGEVSLAPAEETSWGCGDENPV